MEIEAGACQTLTHPEISKSDAPHDGLPFRQAPVLLNRAAHCVSKVNRYAAVHRREVGLITPCESQQNIFCNSPGGAIIFVHSLFNLRKSL